MRRYKSPINITIFLKTFFVIHGNWQQLKWSQKPFAWQQIFDSHDSRSLNVEQQHILTSLIEYVSEEYLVSVFDVFKLF